jgi:hypothetical protein
LDVIRHVVGVRDVDEEGGVDAHLLADIKVRRLTLQSWVDKEELVLGQIGCIPDPSTIVSLLHSIVGTAVGDGCVRVDYSCNAQLQSSRERGLTVDRWVQLHEVGAVESKIVLDGSAGISQDSCVRLSALNGGGVLDRRRGHTEELRGEKIGTAEGRVHHGQGAAGIGAFAGRNREFGDIVKE